MLRNITSRLWRSLKRKGTEVIAGKSPESHTSTNTWSIYSFKTLPFNAYRDCLIEKDLSKLVISGEPPQEILLSSWEEIQEEVSLRLGGDIKKNIRGIFLVETLNSKITRLTSTVLLFIRQPIIELIEVFENEGWKYDRKKIEKEIEEGNIKPYVQYLRNKIGNLQYKFELEKKKYEAKETEEPTHEMYLDLFAEIRKLEGREIPDTILMPEFCNYYKRLMKYAETLKNGSRTNR